MQQAVCGKGIEVTLIGFGLRLENSIRKSDLLHGEWRAQYLSLR
jgi:hypothetical protein